MIISLVRVLILVLISSSVQAQRNRNDSLQKFDYLESKFTSEIGKGAFQKAQNTLDSLKSLAYRLFEINSYESIKCIFKEAQVNVVKRDWNLSISLFRKTERYLIKYYPQKKEIRSSIYNSLGNLYTFKNKLDSALLYHQYALEQRIGLFGVNHIKVATSYNNLAALYLRKKNFPLTIKYFKKEIQIYLANHKGKHQDIARSYNNLARTFTLSNQNDSALYYYQKALIANNKTFSSSKVSDLPTKESAFINNSIAFETLYRKSELLKDSKMIIAHITLADFLAKNIRKSLTYRSEKINFLRRSGRFFESALTKIYQLYSKTIKDKQSLANLFFYFSERSKANVLLDQIAQDNQEHIPIISLPETQQKLQGRNLAILSYVFAQGTLYVSIISGKKVQILPLIKNTTRRKLRRITNKLRGEIQSFDILAYFKEADRAYKQLLDKPLQFTSNAKKILIIPIPELSGAPWEGLIDKPIVKGTAPMKAIEIASYLITKYNIYHHFSVSLALKKNFKAKGGFSKTYLGLGIGDFGGRLPELKQSIPEVEGVANILVNNKGISKERINVFTNKAATKHRLSTKSQIIHLSTHGEYRKSDKSQLTGLYLMDKKSLVLDTLTDKDIYIDQEFDAELVILSGCHSRRGKIARYEGIIGFERVLLQKGVSYILSSSWVAYDEPSKNLLMLFFKHLNVQRWNYNDAWIHAKREYIKKPQLPGTWAGLILIGLKMEGL